MLISRFVPFNQKTLKSNSRFGTLLDRKDSEPLPSSYYKGAHGVILVYDITNRETFADLGKWVEEIHMYCQEGVSKILIGMKSDLDEDRKVMTEEGMAFAQNHGMNFLEVSAKNGTNVQEAFTILANQIKSNLPKNI